jgi:hypothetical protein
MRQDQNVIDMEVKAGKKPISMVPIFRMPERVGQLPKPLTIQGLRDQEKNCKDLFEYMKEQNVHPKTGKQLKFEEGGLIVELPGIKRPFVPEPGLETIMRFFQLGRGAAYKEVIMLPDVIAQDGKKIQGHIKVKAWVQVFNKTTGETVYILEGSASTMESLHRFRGEKRKCPKCEKESIIVGKAEYGGGWLCWKKKDGCGAKFDIDDPLITDQKLGQFENPNPYDQHNTIEEVAVIRALRKIIKYTGMSRYFITDLTAISTGEPEPEPENKKAEPEKTKKKAEPGKNREKEKTDPPAGQEKEKIKGGQEKERREKIEALEKILFDKLVTVDAVKEWLEKNHKIKSLNDIKTQMKYRSIYEAAVKI